MKKLVTTATSLLLVLTLTACSTTEEKQSSQSESSSSELAQSETSDSDLSQSDAAQSQPLQSPIVVGVEGIDGANIEITHDRPLWITSENPAVWTGETEDPNVAVFTPGKDEIHATIDFGFKAVGTGSTKATITHGDHTISFTITVK